jgi:hypothetical protein
MSELTQEAILAELAKLSDSRGRAISFHDGQTIVPNSLLEQVWLEAERNTTKRIIKLLESQIHGCSGYDCDSCDDSSQIVDLIELIKGENK